MLHLQQGVMEVDSLNDYIRTNAHLGRFNRFDLGVLTPSITKNYNNFGNLGRTQLSPPAQRNGRRFGDSTGIEFSASSPLEDESNVSSPPLWKTSPPAATPTPRSQAIDNGRHELMEMIRNVPESAYELSLKDLVELTENRGSMVSEAIQEENMKMTQKKNNKNSKRYGLRNGSVGNRDFLLKMFFPAALRAKKRSSSNGTCSKVSPKPQQMEGEKTGLEKSVDAEWWKKRFSSAGESVNSRTSRSSSNGSSRRSYRDMGGCWSFFHTNRSHM